MELEKLLALLRGEFILFRKDAQDTSAEIKALSKEVQTLGNEVKNQKPPVVNVPETQVNVSPTPVTVEKPDLAPIQEAIEELKEAVLAQEEPEIPAPIVNVTVPEIKVPQAEVKVTIPPIKVPTPQVEFKPKIVVESPKEIQITGLLAWLKLIFDKIQSYSIFNEVSRETPIPVILVDRDKNFYSAKGGGSVSSSSGTTLETPVYATKIESSGSFYYIAEGPLGASTTDPVWRVQRIDLTGPYVFTWADGNDNFDNTADNLTTLNYV